MINPNSIWIHRARPIRVIDGDTVVLLIDHGMSILSEQHVRVLGVNTAEMNSTDPNEREMALRAREFVQDWLDDASMSGRWPLLIETFKDARSFTRYIADVWNLDGENLTNAIITAGLGVRANKPRGKKVAPEVGAS